MAALYHRRNTTIAAALCFFITIPFLILVLIGNTHINKTLNGIYFFKIDLSHVIPLAVDNAHLLNSVVRLLGLRDFYSVGLWNYCDGYNDLGTTYCSPPQTLFYFDPVKVLVSELLSGAQIALPAQMVNVLRLLRIGSRVMFGFFLTGTILNFILLFLTPLVLLNAWYSLGLSIFSFISALLLTVAAIIATVISVAFKIAMTSQDQLNISVEHGVSMFAFMWIAAILSIIAFFLHAGMGCCCSVRPRHSERKASSSPADEKRHRVQLPNFVRRRRVDLT